MTLSHQQKFLTLTELLIEASPLWRPSPFTESRLGWQHQYPELFNQCLALSDSQLSHFEQSPHIASEWLSNHLPQLATINELTQLQRTAIKQFKIPSRWLSGIPGRKAEQITAFAQSLAPKGKHFYDWCCGKAHLGRIISKLTLQSCTGIEQNESLIEQGQQLAKKHQTDVTFVQANVLHDHISLSSNSHVLALHACGDLHRTLIQQIAKQKVGALSLSPCCYPLWLTDKFTPLSKLARSTSLKLTRDDLHLAVQESVTSSERETKQNHQLNSYRLGFDFLQKEINKYDQYLPVPSLPKSMINLTFEDFCHHLAQLKNINLPKNVDYDFYKKLGLEKFSSVRRLQIVRHTFRRAIEIWLILDIALTLEESDYQVALFEFCDRALTPRNILISARLKST